MKKGRNRDSLGARPVVALRCDVLPDADAADAAAASLQHLGPHLKQQLQLVSEQSESTMKTTKHITKKATQHIVTTGTF